MGNEEHSIPGGNTADKVEARNDGDKTRALARGQSIGCSIGYDRWSQNRGV